MRYAIATQLTDRPVTDLCVIPQFSALLDAGLLRDMLSLYNSQTRQYHAIAALGDSVCGHR